MKPGFDFERERELWLHGPGPWHHGFWFNLPPWVAAPALALAVALYFVPAGIAFWRGHHNRAAIGLLNLLLGWTFFGWAVALVWAVTSVKHRRP